EDSVKRLDRTLIDLIELERSRKGTNRLSTISLSQFVNEMLQSLKHLADFDKIDFDLRIDNHTEIVADKVLMLSVFQNLIHNAINYRNVQKPYIRIEVTEEEDGIELKIADNGKGIDKTIQNKVFDMFYRGH